MFQDSHRSGSRGASVVGSTYEESAATGYSKTVPSKDGLQKFAIENFEILWNEIRKRSVHAIESWKIQKILRTHPNNL